MIKGCGEEIAGEAVEIGTGEEPGPWDEGRPSPVVIIGRNHVASKGNCKHGLPCQ